MVHSCGLGCVLISRPVLKKVKFRYSKKYGGFDGVWFCEDAKKAGVEIYVDPKIKCRHLLRVDHGIGRSSIEPIFHK